MTTSDNRKDFTSTAKQAFEASIDQLDADTVSAIARCRRYALEQPAARTAWLLLPAGAVATLALAVGLYFSVSLQNANGLNAEDLEMLSSSESLEFYEDLEFYRWLDESDLAS